MKRLTIAFLYNVRHRYPDPNDPKSHLEADFDDPKTIALMIKYFKKCGYQVIPIEADEKAYFKLFKNKKRIDLAFNYSEGIYGQDREAQLPAILEMLQIPYTGSPPLTQALGLNKVKTKEVLQSHQIPVLPHQVFKTSQEKLEKGLFFPLIVKPIAQGSSAGITNSSVVFSDQELRRQVKFIIQTFSQPALIEPFLTGREFTIAMLGNPPRILPIIESNYTVLPPQYLSLDSLEVKWLFEEETQNNSVICPAKMERPLQQEIKKICFKTWSALEILDYCRVDIRCDQDHQPYVLEVNSPVGLLPPEVSTTGRFPLAARAANLNYEELLKIMINTALKRYHLLHD